MRATDGAQSFNQYVKCKHRGQCIGQQCNSRVAISQLLGHDARADDRTQQCGGAQQF